MPQSVSSGCGNWKDHKNQQKASISKSTTFASYRILLVQITTISFEKVQLHELPVSTKAGHNNIVRLISI